jgi:hypothetical protein
MRINRCEGRMPCDDNDALRSSARTRETIYQDGKLKVIEAKIVKAN